MLGSLLCRQGNIHKKVEGRNGRVPARKTVIIAANRKKKIAGKGKRTKVQLANGASRESEKQALLHVVSSFGKQVFFFSGAESSLIAYPHLPLYLRRLPIPSQ